MSSVPGDYIARNGREYLTGVDDYAAYNRDRSVIQPYLDALCERIPKGARVLDSAAALVGKVRLSIGAVSTPSVSISPARCASSRAANTRPMITSSVT